mgnify:CR=1 FL=1
MVHLVGDVLEESLGSLNAGNHRGELGSDDSLVVQRLAEHLALVDPPVKPLAPIWVYDRKPDSLQALLNDQPLASNRASGHSPSLVVEVRQDNLETLVLLSESMLVGHKHVLESDVRGSSSSRVRSLDRLSLDTGLALDEQHNEATLLSPSTNSEVVGESRIGDPLLAVVQSSAIASHQIHER